MHIVDSFSKFLCDNWIAKLPNRQRSSLVETFDAVSAVLEDELWSLARVGHSLEYGTLDLLVNYIALKLSIKQNS